MLTTSKTATVLAGRHNLERGEAAPPCRCWAPPAAAAGWLAAPPCLPPLSPGPAAALVMPSMMAVRSGSSCAMNLTWVPCTGGGASRGARFGATATERRRRARAAQHALSQPAPPSRAASTKGAAQPCAQQSTTMHGLERSCSVSTDGQAVQAACSASSTGQNGQQHRTRLPSSTGRCAHLSHQCPRRFVLDLHINGGNRPPRPDQLHCRQAATDHAGRELEIEGIENR